MKINHNSQVSGQDIQPIKDRILVVEMEFGHKKLQSGLMLLDDDGTEHGIRARWAKVFKVGPEQKDVQVGDYVLLEHGRWSRAFSVSIDNQKQKLFMVDYPAGLLVISKIKPMELQEMENA